MTRIIHFIVAGKEKTVLHLAGMPRFKADEVVLFDPGRTSKSQTLAEAIKEMGVECRTVPVKVEYPDPYAKATSEAAASLTDDSCIAINASTGSRIVELAVEDAVRVQIYFFDRRKAKKVPCSAFRYIVRPHVKPKIAVAPMWNFFREDFNNIFEILAEADDPVSVREVYDFLCDIDPSIGAYEAFRKTFRDFRRSFDTLPCFHKRLGKTPRYRIIL